MNTARWLTNRTPRLMFHLLGVEYTTRRVDGRKLRLFSVACWRRVWDLLADDRLKALVEAQEAFADGSIDQAMLETALAEVVAIRDGTKGSYRSTEAREQAFWMAHFGVTFQLDHMGGTTSRLAGERVRREGSVPSLVSEDSEVIRLAERTESRAQADLAREIFGDPFRPSVFDPSWLTWNDGLVPKLAEVIYQDNAFDRLPILGDALEEAGCVDPRILEHCRREGGHVRGCWVLDALLGRE